jgi:orotate phosphoribosyltransferase-like protein
MPTPEERQEPAAKKPRAKYMGRKALLALFLSKSPSTRKWLIAKMDQHSKVKEKAERDIKILARSLGVKLKKLEIE